MWKKKIKKEKEKSPANWPEGVQISVTSYKPVENTEVHPESGKTTLHAASVPEMQTDPNA